MHMRTEGREKILIGVFCLLGIALRFWVMTLGHNYDFESFCIVGEIASKFQNVYAETARYNYGPIFFCIQGMCYALAQIISPEPILAFRILIVSILTLTDIGIMAWLVKRYSWKLGLVFFLNPVSIIITGYHNQFDNIAVLFALISCFFYNERERFDKKDFWFVFFLALSLITKHLLYIFPLWILLKKSLPLKKKVVYSVAPVIAFFISFIPFIIGNKAAFQGVLDHVFLYRSTNNAPLLIAVYYILHVPDKWWFVIYVAIMAGISFLVRNKSYEYQLLFYFLCMVTFSSAMANQYFIIPIVALCVFSKGVCRCCYFIEVLLCLLVHYSGFNLLPLIAANLADGMMLRIITIYARGGGYVFATVILFTLVLREMMDICGMKYRSVLLKKL